MKQLTVDPKLCTGCRVCEIVCTAYRRGVFNYKRARIKVQPSYPLPTAPNFCRQCEKPDCVDACPTNSIYQDPASGIVFIDEESCSSCGACTQACSFDAIFEDVATGLPIKCDLCGGEPNCLQHCPTRALGLSQ